MIIEDAIFEDNYLQVAIDGVDHYVKIATIERFNSWLAKYYDLTPYENSIQLEGDGEFYTESAINWDAVQCDYHTIEYAQLFVKKERCFLFQEAS